MIEKKKAVFVIILLGIVLSLLSTLLTTMSFHKMQAENYVHARLLSTVSAVRKLNYALSFGKPLDKYYGLDHLLYGIMELSEDILGVEVTDEHKASVLIVGEMEEGVRQGGTGEEYEVKSDGIYAFTPFDCGMLILRLDTSSVNRLTKEFLIFMLVLDLILVLLVGLTVNILFGRCGDEIMIKKLRVNGILILIASQLILGGIAMERMDRSYKDSIDQIARDTACMVENDINDVIEKGVQYEEITRINEYLDELVLDIPEISKLSLSDSEVRDGKNVLGYEMNISGSADSALPFFCIYDYNWDLINERRINNGIDIIILVMITVFVSLEAVSFFTKHFLLSGTRKRGELYLPGFRLFVFFEGIAFSLDGSFFSVYSRKLYLAMGLPDSMSFLSGMPHTMYSAAIVTGLIFSRSLIQRLGMKRVLSVGVMSGVAGYVLCAVSLNLPMLIAARFIYGFCNGLLINCIRLFAASQSDPRIHTRILVDYMSAINLGVSCGVVIGGLIADVSSYTVVFLTGAVLGSLCLFLILFAGFPERSERSTERMLFLSSFQELRIPRVLVYMFAVVLPVYIATLFVSYSFPLFGDEAGFSNSMVSGCLMINYIIIAYLTKPIADMVIKHFLPRTAMGVYMLLQAVSIGIFVIAQTPLSALAALVLTSFWDCFGMVVIDLGLSDVKEASMEKCTLLQMLFGKLGLVAGPPLITARLQNGAARATGITVIFLLVGFFVYTASYFLMGVKHRK